MSAEPDYLPADALAEDEPKYLRRQKPVEIRKRKFSRKAWPLYRRVLVGAIAALASGLVLYQAGNYFLFSPSVMIERADQIEISGNRFQDLAYGVVCFAQLGLLNCSDNVVTGCFVPRCALAARYTGTQERLLRCASVP